STIVITTPREASHGPHYRPPDHRHPRQDPLGVHRDIPCLRRTPRRGDHRRPGHAPWAQLYADRASSAPALMQYLRTSAIFAVFEVLANRRAWLKPIRRGITCSAASGPLWVPAPINDQLASSVSHSATAVASPAAHFAANSPTMAMPGALPQSLGRVICMNAPSSIRWAWRELSARGWASSSAAPGGGRHRQWTPRARESTPRARAWS